MATQAGRQGPPQVPAQIPWSEFQVHGRRYRRVDLHALAAQAGAALERLPFAMRVLLENLARNLGPGWATGDELARLLAWSPGDAGAPLPLRVSRVILPDSSGLPVLMDMAALRAALARQGRDPRQVQPQIPVDLVVDHSVMVDHYGRPDALVLNMQREFERNDERYRFFKWARQAFDGVRVVPPGIGIIHQVHLEHVAQVVTVRPDGPGATGVDDAASGDHASGLAAAFPEFVLGGDSHTPMVNGLGVLGWGVGGVEAEAAMLGQPYVMPWPHWVGVRLEGRLAAGATTTDLVLTVTERLRAAGVVGAIVEFGGAACALLAVPDRATIANMAPEYGATAAYFPIDANTIDYLRQTGRAGEQVALVEAYARASGLFRGDEDAPPLYDENIDIDLGDVVPSVSGPSRPQQRQPLREVPQRFRAALARPVADGGYGLAGPALHAAPQLSIDGGSWRVGHGMIAIAAITACTNTSNPGVMLAAGLLARNAVRAGLSVPGYVKTSLAPGSRVVTRYLDEAGLLAPLEKLGFYVVGYGCTTCSGKSGPLPEPVSQLIDEHGLIAAAVLSSNRNFEGRVHRQVRAAYLASPPLVVAYALAGRVDIDPEREPLGRARDGTPVYLRELWPDPSEVRALLERTRDPELYRSNYEHAFDGTPQWQSLEAPVGTLYPWDPTSTYLLEPPFFDADPTGPFAPLPDVLEGARALAVFGDGLSTDHISPAVEIPRDSAAGRYLAAQGVAPRAFNAFTMRRGNHHVMVRGTFAHPRTRNLLLAQPSGDGGNTLLLPQRRECAVHEAAEAYGAAGVPVIVIGGRDYGMGSSRDWAAKGPRLLGVRAVLAESFERIHRANLVALGIAPLRFADGQSLTSLGLDGSEAFTLRGLAAGIDRGEPVAVEARSDRGKVMRFTLAAEIGAPAERQMLREGGIFARVLRMLLERLPPAASAQPSNGAAKC